MKNHSRKLFALISFTSVLFFVAANASTAQVSTKAGKQSIRQFLLEKQQKTQFTLSPAKHLPEFLNNSLDPCTMASPADIGQSIGNAHGDRKADIGVFRPSTRFWYFLNSTSGFAFRHYGDPGDIPIPNSFIR